MSLKALSRRLAELVSAASSRRIADNNATSPESTLAELKAALRVRREKGEQVAQEHKRLVESRRALHERVKIAEDSLIDKCRALGESLTSNEDAGLESWALWLRAHHASHKHVWAPGQQARTKLVEHGAVARADEICERLIALAAQLGSDEEIAEISEDDVEVRCRSLAHDAERLRDDLRSFSAEPDRDLQIVRDLPDPYKGKTGPELQEMHHVLTFLAALLGRYAASAALETQMLESI